MDTGATAAASPDALSRELARERVQSAHRINLLRFWGVSAFFALFLLLGGLLRLPAWTGNLGLFAVYWVVTFALFLTARRSDRVARFGTLAIAHGRRADRVPASVGDLPDQPERQRSGRIHRRRVRAARHPGRALARERVHRLHGGH